MPIPEHRPQAKSGLCIFVVDDNCDACDSLADLLSICGHRCHKFHDPFEALSRAPEHQPCAAILDIGMPGMSGLDLARRMRECCPSTLLIACTGWGTADDRARTRAAGFAHHLVKPAALADIEGILRAVPARSTDAIEC